MGMGPITLSDSGRARTGIVGGSFVLQGASAPSDLGGDIIAAEHRLKGGAPFVRVTFRTAAGYHKASSSVTATAYLSNTVSTLTAVCHVGSIIATAGPVIDERTQIDISVTDAAGAAIDTAGIRINVDGTIDI